MNQYKKKHTHNCLFNEKNIILITPNRVNPKNKTELNYVQQLKSRYKVEHFFSLLKRGYKRISMS